MACGEASGGKSGRESGGHPPRARTNTKVSSRHTLKVRPEGVATALAAKPPVARHLQQKSVDSDCERRFHDNSRLMFKCGYVEKASEYPSKQRSRGNARKSRSRLATAEVRRDGGNKRGRAPQVVTRDPCPSEVR